MAANRQTARAAELLGELVSIDSVNPDMPGGERGEREYGDFLAGYGRRLGLEVSQYEVLPGRFNTALEMPAPGAARRLVFDIHLDTVPFDGPVSTNKPVQKDGRLYGRGACDTKGAMAAALLALERLLADPPDPGCELVLLATVDEEYLKRGVDAAVERGLRADGAIVGEPTGLVPVIAHKGVARWEVVTRGRAAHTSKPENGINAIYQMAAVIERLVARHAVTPPELRHALCGDGTLAVSTIAGGVQVNVVPDECRVQIDRRVLPSEQAQTTWQAVTDDLKRLQAESPGMQLESLAPFLLEEGLDTDPTAAIVSAACAAGRGLVLPDEPAGVPYGTDGSSLSLGGIPVVVLGPGDIDQAHSPDEYVELDQVVDCARLYEAIVREFAATGATL
jgi:acetylornithine deacetylase/succinyl-diaminopimelate desuccinylase-like protein